LLLKGVSLGEISAAEREGEQAGISVNASGY
jgi:hypothetical protein